MFDDLEPKVVSSKSEYVELWRSALHMYNIHNVSITTALSAFEKGSIDMTELREIIMSQFDEPVLA